MLAEFYYPIYLIVVIILTIWLSSNYRSKSNDELLEDDKASYSREGWILAILLTLFIGFRPLSGYYFVDMANYNEFYYALSYGRPFTFSFTTNNIIFDNLFNWLGANYFDIRIFFVLIAAIYFLGTYKAVERLFPRDSLFAYVVFLGAFSTFSYATNGIKAGAAAALFLCALAYNDKKWVAALFLFASLGFHHSMIVPIVAFILSVFVKNPKYYFVFWVVCLLIAAAHITYFQYLFTEISNDESAIGYLTSKTDDWGGKTGFRLDFIIYSALPIIIGYYTLFRYKIASENYDFILNAYLFTNGIWMLCMYIPFTNRVAYLSWLMYPVVLIYPFLNCEVVENQAKYLNNIVWIQLAFTLLMYFI